jgi:digeranylgeranylglycerophospholipid reductase
MDEPRVCIVGGGPAGLAAAIEAAGMGLAVDLYERNRIGEHIRCAEGFVDTMHLLGVPGAGVRFKVNEVLLQVDREYRVRCPGVRLWMIDRSEWQRSLGDRALAAGVRLHERARIDRQAFQELQHSYDWVIDASGAPSMASLQHGFRNYYRENSAYTVQYVLEGDFSSFGNRLKFVLLPRCMGYYWVFPKGHDARGRSTANVGLGIFREGGPGRPNGGPGGFFMDASVGRAGRLWELLDRFCAQERVEGSILRRHGGIVPIRLQERLQYGNVLLVGDAAGCASPMHGGGIDTSFAMGRLAARWIAAQAGRLPGEEFPADKNRSYHDVVWDLFRPKLRIEHQICELWSQLERPALDTVVSLVTRDWRQMRLWSALPLGWLLFRYFGAGLRLWSGLTRGRW